MSNNAEEKTVDTRYTQERELSWLRFNERVLEEARDESVPLFERLKFAAIFTSNLTEFFMIRVGSISDMALSREHHVDSKSGLTPRQQLQAIFKAVPALYKLRDKAVSRLEKRLRSCNICRLDPGELDGRERKQTERWFRDYVQPVLSPMVVDIHHPFPHLPSGTLAVDWTYTPDTARVMTITANVVMELDGVEYTFTMDVELDVLDADSLVYIGIDASHYNEYVAGNYKDSMGNFGQLAAGYSVRTVELATSQDLLDACQNADGKYVALILTAPSRRDGSSLRDPDRKSVV